VPAAPSAPRGDATGPVVSAPRGDATGPVVSTPRGDATGPVVSAPRADATGPVVSAPRGDATGPAPRADATGPDASAPRPLRGRVAFPIRADQTPAPSTLPKEVDELAVAGEPPMPARRSSRPLTGQTESLSSIRARQRKRTFSTFALCALGAAVLGGGVYLVTRGPATGPGAEHADLAGPPPRPDRTSPDLPRPDLARPDAPRPDAARPDLPAKRRVSPVALGKKGRRPDAGAPPTAAARAEAQASYQDGLRRLLVGQSEEAVRLFNQALTKQPRFSLAYRGLGLAYQKLGRKAMARAAFERYLLLQPGADDADAIRARIAELKD
jgi:hypothetical protein